LGYLDETAEKRTGQNKGAAGLDMDALQSTTKGGVEAAVNGSQAQAELIARNFAEQALKPLFRGVLKLLIEHQDRKRMVRLRGKWVDVNPGVWDSDMDVQVNVALGSGLIEKKIAILAGMAEKQKEILATLGPVNALVTMGQYRNTLAKAAKLANLNPDEFFKTVDDKALEAQAAQADQQAPPPDPQMALAQAEIEREKLRMEHDLQLAGQKLELERQKAVWEDDRERDKQAAEIAVAMYKLQAETGLAVSQQELDTAIEHHRTQSQAGVDMHATEAQAQVDMHATENQPEAA
jgi:hypothetical protein